MHDEQFENFLRKFEPRRPRALPEAKAEPSLCYQRFAAAAVVGLVLAGSLWLVGSRVVRKPPRTIETDARLHPSVLSLTRLAFEDPARLDAVLDEASRESLSDFENGGRALRVLGTE